MTSQQKPDQNTQDNRYSNQDKSPHQGPIKTTENQPGPKVEKETPSHPDQRSDIRK